MGRMAEARKRARQEAGRDAPGEARAATAGAEPIQLPASGLAEDILRQLETKAPAADTPVKTADATPETEAAPPDTAWAEPPPRHIELPASGLAEEILGAERPPVPLAGELQHPAGPRPAEAASVAGSHSMSFFAAPAHDQRATVEATEHLVTFYLDREEYGVDVRQVQEIRRLTEITTVPRAPEFVRGVINLRGRILPVLDLKRKLGLGQVEGDRATRIVVVRVRDRLLGLLVDGASQVPKIPVSRIEAAPEEVVERGGDYIRGVAKLDDRLIILVDLERLLAHELTAPAAPVSTVRAAAGPDGPSQE